MQEHIQLKVSDVVVSTRQSGATIYAVTPMPENSFSRVFEGPDHNSYKISQDLILTVPHDVGTAWMTVDPDLVQVSRS